MALSKTRLASALQPVIESKIRTYVISGDLTPYPELTDFSQALAEAIANEVVDEIKNNASLKNVSWGGGTFGGSVSGATCSTTIAAQTNITGGVE